MSDPGTLHFMIGKMGAGKSTYSIQLSQNSGAILISEDEWLTKLYPNEVNSIEDFVVRHRKLLKVLKPHVQQLLSAGLSVVMDFPANTQDSRLWFIEVAKSAGAAYHAIYLKASNQTCLEHIAQRRLEQPERAQYDTEEMFHAITEYFEEPSLDEGLTFEVVAST